MNNRTTKWDETTRTLVTRTRKKKNLEINTDGRHDSFCLSEIRISIETKKSEVKKLEDEGIERKKVSEETNGTRMLIGLKNCDLLEKLPGGTAGWRR